MEVPLEIRFEDMEPSDAVKQRIQEEVNKLEQVFDHITSCHVAVFSPHKTPENHNLFGVKIFMSLPNGKSVKVDKNPSQKFAHSDIYVAIRDSFNAAQRQLKDQKRKLEGQVKNHQATEPPRGKILEVYPGEGYGFLKAEDGREIYFHQNSLVDAEIEQIEPGLRVNFREERGRKGPQATFVKPAGGPRGQIRSK